MHASIGQVIQNTSKIHIIRPELEKSYVQLATHILGLSMNQMPAIQMVTALGSLTTK
jgi:hypothetical protein